MAEAQLSPFNIVADETQEATVTLAEWLRETLRLGPIHRDFDHTRVQVEDAKSSVERFETADGKLRQRLQPERQTSDIVDALLSAREQVGRR
jgi:hypothetical protein